MSASESMKSRAFAARGRKSSQVFDLVLQYQDEVVHFVGCKGSEVRCSLLLQFEAPCRNRDGRRGSKVDSTRELVAAPMRSAKRSLHGHFHISGVRSFGRSDKEMIGTGVGKLCDRIYSRHLYVTSV